MEEYLIINECNKKILGSRIIKADNFFSRFLGLMGKKELKKGSGLMITPCNSIHMMFMKFSLDVIFLDKERKIIHQIVGIKPWRISPVIFGACYVLELPVGTIAETETKVSDFLIIEKAADQNNG